MKSLLHAEQALVSNEQFWGATEVLRTQQTEDSFLYWYEKYLVETAARALAQRFDAVRRIHVVACGPGRELQALRRAFPAAHIVASDIAPPAVAACRANLQRWNCTENIEVKCCSADELTAADGLAELMISFGSLLTYVMPADARVQMLRQFRALLQPSGLLIGVAHHRWGKLTKSGFFAAQQLARALRLTAQTPGDYHSQFAGMRTLIHYFTADELRGLLQTAGFAPREVHSLATLGRQIGRPYRATGGDNNLLYLGQAQP